MEKMILKCKCGTWVRAEKTNFFKRAVREFNNTVKPCENLGESLGALIGNSALANAGKAMGKIYGSGFGFVMMPVGAIFGHSFQFECPNCGAQYGTDDESEDQTAEYEEEQRIKRIVENLSKQIEQNIDEIIRCKGSHLSVSSQILSHLESIHAEAKRINIAPLIKQVATTLAVAYSISGKTETAIGYIDESLSLSDNRDSRVIRGLITGESSDPQKTRESISDLMHIYRETSEDEKQSEFSCFFTQSEVESAIERLYDSYILGLANLPVSMRQHLVFSTRPKTSGGDSIIALPIYSKSLAFQFPQGHPRENILYRAHPYRHNYYIPFDSYHYELFKDELQEYVWLMECLGAKQIDYRDKQDRTDGQQTVENKNISGKLDIVKADLTVDFKSGTDKERFRNLINEYKAKRSFSISCPPYVPDDLVWYKHRLQWQRDVASRQEGRLNHATQTISTEEISDLSDSEYVAIEAELNTIIKASIKGAYSSDKKVVLKRTSKEEWDIDVQFYEMSEYQNRNTTIPNQDALPVAEKSRNSWVIISGIAAATAAIAGLVYYFI